MQGSVITEIYLEDNVIRVYLNKVRVLSVVIADKKDPQTKRTQPAKFAAYLTSITLKDTSHGVGWAAMTLKEAWRFASLFGVPREMFDLACKAGGWDENEQA